MQIRAVLTVFRSEGARLRRRYAADSGADALERLRVRSIELLDNARAELNGEAQRNPELVDELDAARAEVSDTAAGRLDDAARRDEAAEGHAEARPVSAGSRGGRPG